MTARVLIVDDFELNVKLLEAKLASEYFDVLTASDGASALAIAQRQQPDVILLDVMMPDMDGFETCGRLKAYPGTADIPVIMVTALSDIADRLQGLEAGADDFLTKPVNDTALFARLRSLVRLRRMTEELRLRDSVCGRLGGPAEGREGEKGAARLLIIEESAADAAYMEKTLAPIAATILSARSHAEARSLVERGADLVIASLSVPDGDTLRLVSQCRASERLRRLPIVLIADPGDMTRIAKGLDLGADDYLVRPVDRSELAARATTQLRRKRLHDRLRENQLRSLSLALTDELTGLYNRRYATAHLEEVIVRARAGGAPTAVLLFDIDHFKNVNDDHGHAVGDLVLRELAHRVTTNLRSLDLVARLGGEEFLVVMPETDLPTGMNVAERLRQRIAEEPYRCDGKEIRVTISLGLTLAAAKDDPATLFTRADTALYAAKNSGRNRLAVRRPDEQPVAAAS